MKRFLTIGDLHGRDDWKRVDPEKYDKIIFIGDYVDSFTVGDSEMIMNLRELIEFKTQNSEKIELLLGNHDLQYYYNNIKDHGCSGVRMHLMPILHELYRDNKKLFKAAYGYKNYLWTHAGISSRVAKLIKMLPYDKEMWADELNRLFYAYEEYLFCVGYSRGGDYANGSIFWAHKDETVYSQVEGLHQIVGHTPVETIECHTNEGLDGGSSITYVDNIEYGDGEFYEVEIN